MPLPQFKGGNGTSLVNFDNFFHLLWCQWAAIWNAVRPPGRRWALVWAAWYSVMWAGSQRQPLNIPVLVSGAAGPASCPWVTDLLVTLSDQKWEWWNSRNRGKSRWGKRNNRKRNKECLSKNSALRTWNDDSYLVFDPLVPRTSILISCRSFYLIAKQAQT